MDARISRTHEALKRGGPLRLEGLVVHAGDGQAASPRPIQVAAGCFVPPTAEAEVVDLGGWVLLPGLCDAHLHLFHEARRSLRVDLAGVHDRAEIWDRLSMAPAQGPVIAVGWDESEWTDQRFPTRVELDRLFPDRPAGLLRVCGHAAVANSPALAQLGEGQGRADIVSGLLLEEAAVALSRRFPPDPAALLREAATVADALAARGLTDVTDMGALELPALVQALPDDFPLRVEYFHAGPLGDLPARMAGATHRPLGRKFFLDGSIGGRSAAVDAPYSEGGRGGLLHETETLREELSAALSAGWRVALHAIGERALGQALEVLVALRPDEGRVRLEHVEMAAEVQLEILDGLGVSVCMQPNFMDRWGRPGGLYERALGADYAGRFTHPGDFRRRGILLAYGTDGMPARLWPALAAAVDEGIFGEGADTPCLALAAVSGDAARAAGRDAVRGRVAAGLAADFCLVPTDPCAEHFRNEPEPVLTVRAGQPTWLDPRYQGR